MKWPPQFEDVVSIKRDAGGLSILHSRGEIPHRVRALAVALALIAWAVFDRSDPFLLVLLITAYPGRRMASLRITGAGFDFAGGPCFTREEFVRAAPTGGGEIAFEFRGGQRRAHFHRLSEIQTAQIVEAVDGFVGAPGDAELTHLGSPRL